MKTKLDPVTAARLALARQHNAISERIGGTETEVRHEGVLFSWREHTDLIGRLSLLENTIKKGIEDDDIEPGVGKELLEILHRPVLKRGDS